METEKHEQCVACPYWTEENGCMAASVPDSEIPWCPEPDMDPANTYWGESS